MNEIFCLARQDDDPRLALEVESHISIKSPTLTSPKEEVDQGVRRITKGKVL